METTKEFDEADYYSIGDDTDGLSYTSWEEAVGSFFDDTTDFGLHVKDHCVQLAPLEVVAWKRKELKRNWPEEMVERFIEELIDADMMAESWWEEYGDPDGDYPPIVAKVPSEQEAVKQLNYDLTETLFRWMKKHSHVWQCNLVCKREMSLEELQEFAKINYPEEWEKPYGE